MLTLLENPKCTEWYSTVVTLFNVFTCSPKSLHLYWAVIFQQMTNTLSLGLVIRKQPSMRWYFESYVNFNVQRITDWAESRWSVWSKEKKRECLRILRQEPRKEVSPIVYVDLVQRNLWRSLLFVPGSFEWSADICEVLLLKEQFFHFCFAWQDDNTKEQDHLLCQQS